MEESEEWDEASDDARDGGDDLVICEMELLLNGNLWPTKMQTQENYTITSNATDMH